ncbi:MAG: ABC transporter permease [Calditrichaeota bacterium]|nr:MAG: ABC transporter permease [Calditrichota bacterium]
MKSAPAKPRRRLAEWLITMPSFAWLFILFLIPTLIIFAISFRTPDPFGGVGKEWSLEVIKNWGDFHYAAIIWRTIWISLVTTLLCIVIAIPTAYQIARSAEKWRKFLLLLIIVPFWTNFLIRIFAWKIVLHPEGVFKRILVALQLIENDTTLLYSSGAVLLVMVYTYLPFAVLPIYAAAEKFDFRLIEAARDLGARSLQAFMRIFLPGISRGVMTAVLMVFIPTLGAYVIPDLVGGPNSEMIGNKIAQRTFVDRNLPQASWLAALLTLAVLAPMLIVLSLQNRRKEKGSILTEGL